jgi:hypothetical protein
MSIDEATTLPTADRAAWQEAAVRALATTVGLPPTTAETWVRGLALGFPDARTPAVKSADVVYRGLSHRVIRAVARTAPTSRMTASRSGKMPTTSVRRRISRLSRSLGLLLQICRHTSFGKAVKARLSTADSPDEEQHSPAQPVPLVQGARDGHRRSGEHNHRQSVPGLTPGQGTPQMDHQPRRHAPPRGRPHGEQHRPARSRDAG